MPTRIRDKSLYSGKCVNEETTRSEACSTSITASEKVPSAITGKDTAARKATTFFLKGGFWSESDLEENIEHPYYRQRELPITNSPGSGSSHTSYSRWEDLHDYIYVMQRNFCKRMLNGDRK